MKLSILVPFLFACLTTVVTASENITDTDLPADLETRSVLNGGCTGAGGAPGVCIHTGSCTNSGGTFITGACPSTPDDVKCCTKPKCGTGGNCRWTSQCGSGVTQAGLCPGPTNFKCCLPGSGGGGGGSGGQPSTTALKILNKAKEAKGIPYVWAGGSCSGATGSPRKGFDCSGLVSWAVCQVTGRNLFSEGLRVTYEMYCASDARRKYKKIPYAQRRAGDAVYFGGNNCNCANPKDVHHVGLMLDSGTRMWNALQTGTNVREDNFAGWSGRNKPCPYVIRYA
ncbi:hypothetical protein B0H63DRAFT_535930 [Podospora didyma]|uniref:NlpC/P60 domain-containing protein n=1 Tax=Podospora didyma TaxID=330526 RepID=A0AAE0K0I6_9PEZI|nr:hypothetical protein B0H63DRAFT_535930 [Podospora didyma]